MKIITYRVVFVSFFSFFFRIDEIWLSGSGLKLSVTVTRDLFLPGKLCVHGNLKLIIRIVMNQFQCSSVEVCVSLT